MKEVEKVYDSIVEDSKDEILVGKKKYKIGWLKPGTRRRMSHTIIKYSNDDTLEYRCASIALLNGFFAIKLFQWFLWRWFFYIKEYSSKDLAPIIEISKKKATQTELYQNMAYLIGVRDTLIKTNLTAVESILQKQDSEHSTQ